MLIWLHLVIYSRCHTLSLQISGYIMINPQISGVTVSIFWGWFQDFGWAVRFVSFPTGKMRNILPLFATPIPRKPYISSRWFQPPWKICASNWIIPPGRVENKKYVKPPPGFGRPGLSLTRDGANLWKTTTMTRMACCWKVWGSQGKYINCNDLVGLGLRRLEEKTQHFHVFCTQIQTTTLQKPRIRQNGTSATCDTKYLSKRLANQRRSTTHGLPLAAKQPTLTAQPKTSNRLQ